MKYRYLIVLFFVLTISCACDPQKKVHGTSSTLNSAESSDANELKAFEATTLPRHVQVAGFTSTKQKRKNWCWAACGEAILKYITKPPKQQCELVTETSSVSGGCCNNIPNVLFSNPLEANESPCNMPASFDLKFGNKTYFNLNVTIKGTMFDKDLVKKYLAFTHRPVLFLVTDTKDGSVGHYVLVVGYDIDDDNNTYYYIFDPMVTNVFLTNIDVTKSPYEITMKSGNTYYLQEYTTNFK